MIGMTPGQDPAEHERAHELSDNQRRRRLVGGAADADDEEAEAGAGQRCTGEVEGMFGARRLRQRLHADQQCNDAERQVDREQPGPGPESEDA